MDITTCSNVAYRMTMQGVGVEKGKETEESAEYEVVGASYAQLPPHPQSQAVLAEKSDYDVPCPPEYPRQAPAMNVPPVPQEKGSDEVIYEPIPGDQ